MSKNSASPLKNVKKFKKFYEATLPTWTEDGEDTSWLIELRGRYGFVYAKNPSTLIAYVTDPNVMTHLLRCRGKFLVNRDARPDALELAFQANHLPLVAKVLRLARC